ncbi:hypothetical protein AXG93_1275s1250 [Marchantia polymorpha subsp. ruderalis]|uniref:Cytochrome c-553 n=1 Tax=Marchantia polymorpha subsp. ruderalis TaxID=1480154 RepID=A0A176VLB0_MARPO|nr:hypothetical protein AXG93_1275s1250 [Marchantia polymorpha subsp. ruderalis]
MRVGHPHTRLSRLLPAVSSPRSSLAASESTWFSRWLGNQTWSSFAVPETPADVTMQPRPRGLNSVFGRTTMSWPEIQFMLVIGRNCNVEDDDEFSSSKNWASSDQVSKALSTVTAFGAAALLTSASFDVGAAIALDGVEVGALFQRTCAGCHTGGGNVLQPSATLFNKDLDRNGLSTVDDIFKITYFGKNRMPGYGEKCTPRGQCTFGPRLGEEDIRALAEFVKSQADQGWTSVQN